MVQFLRHQPGKLDTYRECEDFYLMEAISYRIERSWYSVEIDSEYRVSWDFLIYILSPKYSKPQF